MYVFHVARKLLLLFNFFHVFLFEAERKSSLLSLSGSRRLCLLFGSGQVLFLSGLTQMAWVFSQLCNGLVDK